MPSVNLAKFNISYSTVVIACIAIYLLLYFLNRDVARAGAYILALIGLYEVYRDNMGRYSREFVLKVIIIFSVAITITIYLNSICCDNNFFVNKPFLHFLVLFPFVPMILILNGWLKWFLVVSILFMVAGIFSYAHSDYPLFSAKYFESHYEVYLLLTPIAYAVSKSKIKLNVIFNLLTLSGIFVGLAALADYTGFARSEYWIFDSYPDQLNRGVGASLNPIHFALIATSIFAAVVSFSAMMLSLRNYKYLFYVIASITLLSFAIISSGARTAWISLPLIFIIPFILSPITTKIKLTISGLIVLISIVIYQIPYVNNRINLINDEIMQYTTSTELDDSVRSVTSIGLRLELWKASWEVFLSNPVFGVGPGNFKSYMQDHNYGFRGRYHKEISVHKNAHNLYFKALSERGSLGFITVLLILGLPSLLYISNIHKANLIDTQVYAITGLLIIVVFALGGLTIGSLHKTDLSIFYVFSTAIFSGLLLSSKQYANNSRYIDTLRQLNKGYK